VQVATDEKIFDAHPMDNAKRRKADVLANGAWC